MEFQFNPWHSVDPGNKLPEIVRAIIEIPAQSRAKYELDKDSGMLILDRVLYSSVYYPANYGFIPQTFCDDKDPLDILVISQIAVVPMCIVEAEVIGVMRMIDNEEADDKIIAVATHDMSVGHIDDIDQLPDHFLRELRAFFEDYKKLEHKTVRIEEFLGKEEALKIVSESFVLYDQVFPGD